MAVCGTSVGIRHRDGNPGESAGGTNNPVKKKQRSVVSAPLHLTSHVGASEIIGA